MSYRETFQLSSSKSLLRSLTQSLAILGVTFWYRISALIGNGEKVNPAQVNPTQVERKVTAIGCRAVSTPLDPLRDRLPSMGRFISGG